MSKPFFEEEYKWYDIEIYKSDDVAENGDHAKIHRFTSESEPNSSTIIEAAKKLDCDVFAIREKIETEKHYYVFEVNS